tara:strand:+ start:9756 stop:11021 length:1266 start_codon:yes stop_codon:yes gene_type:complete
MRATPASPRSLLESLFSTAVRAASPRSALPAYLPADTSRPAIVIGAGKAAASMAASLEQHWQGTLSGLVVTRYGHAEACSRIEVVEAAHPVPDAAGERNAQRVLGLLEGLRESDLVICLLSGGGSSLLACPANDISLADKQAINRDLLRSGATISEINCVRKHLSAIKGGRLARACGPARLITYAISDVPGDDPAVIASGPTVADATHSADALAILKRYSIATGEAVGRWLQDPRSETLKPGDGAFANSEYHLIARPADALAAAASAARAQGLEVVELGDAIEGEARDVGAHQAAMARELQRHARQPTLLLSGGETSVSVNGSGRGGRNAEFLLAVACALQGASGIYAIAADTDGIDGSEDNAGALLAPDSWQRAQALGLDAAAMLDNNDGYGFFEALGDLLFTGPTRTNVNDFRALLVLP